MKYRHTLIASMGLLAALGTQQAIAGAYLEPYDDIYTTRSEEIGRYDRIFKAGQEAGTKIEVRNIIMEEPIVNDLSNDLARPEGKRGMVMKPSKEEVGNRTQQKMVKNHDTRPRSLSISVLGKAPVKVDIYNPDAFKNEWITLTSFSQRAGSLETILKEILPVGWRLDLQYLNLEDKERKFEFAVSDTREGAITELLADTGYEFKYFYENKDVMGQALPIMIVHPEAK